jgi:hypothetical protein
MNPVEEEDHIDWGLGAKDWDSKLVFHHVFKLPREHFYGTLGLELTARPVGRIIGEGCYQR